MHDTFQQQLAPSAVDALPLFYYLHHAETTDERLSYKDECRLVLMADKLIN